MKKRSPPKRTVGRVRRLGEWSGSLRRTLDLWFPTTARWLGLLLIGYSIFVDMLIHPALLTVGVGLTLAKTVFGSKDDE